MRGGHTCESFRANGWIIDRFMKSERECESLKVWGSLWRAGGGGRGSCFRAVRPPTRVSDLPLSSTTRLPLPHLRRRPVAAPMETPSQLQQLLRGLDPDSWIWIHEQDSRIKSETKKSKFNLPFHGWIIFQQLGDPRSNFQDPKKMDIWSDVV